jgi:hypothetical protein
MAHILRYCKKSCLSEVKMHKLHFFPVGNADCCRIDLENGGKILFDFGNECDPDDENDCRVDIAEELRNDLRSCRRKDFDVVAFTHLDKDHYCRATEFFFLEHDEKYQGEGRIKIKELWVPAAAITETGLKEDEAKVLQKEAKYRLKEGKGIRVFSRPDRLKEWLEKEGLSVEQRKNLITDAGQLIPGFSKAVDGVEFFVHSPFAKRMDDGGLEDRNQDAIVVQATFLSGSSETKFILAADATYGVLSDIVNITKAKNNDGRLEWDIFKLPHHCSYLSLNEEGKKGDDITEPVSEVKWLFEEQAQKGGVIVSTSKPIPSKGTAEDRDIQPPHRQAANYYKKGIDKFNGDFIVTMEHPKKEKPEPLVIKIDSQKATIERMLWGGGIATTSQPSPRAGNMK